ncbi:MAG: hypothetical protein Q4D76_20305, partial [Oscillospiraceae bacterium]|nr:hypothetical protein [Oscillospiraceae bacterium]
MAEKYVEQTKNLYADDSIKKYISEMLYAEVLSGIGHIERAREILNKIISQTEKQSGFRYKIFIEASIMLAKIYYF